MFSFRSFTFAVFIALVNKCGIAKGKIELVSVECVDAGDITYPTFQFPGDKDWLETYPNDGDFEKRVADQIQTQPGLEPGLQAEKFSICDKNVQYEFDPAFFYPYQCYNSTEKYGFLPNSNKFALSIESNEFAQPDITTNIRFNKERPFLRFWMAADLPANCTDLGASRLCEITFQAFGNEYSFPVDNSTCPDTGRWKRYTFFMGDPISDFLGNGTFREAAESIGADFDLSGVSRADILIGVLFHRAFQLTLSGPQGAAFDNIEFGGGNLINLLNINNVTYDRAASLTEIKTGDTSEGFGNHLENNPIDLMIFMLFILFTTVGVILIAADIKKIDTSKVMSRFLKVWFLLSIVLSLYGIIDLLSFIQKSEEFEEIVLRMPDDVSKSLETNAFSELVEQAKGVEPNGFLIQTLISFPANKQLQLLELFDVPTEAGWTNYQKEAVATTCIAPGYNSQYICLGGDSINCTQDKDSSDFEPAYCYKNCPLYAANTITDYCRLTGDNESYVNFTNCPLLIDAVADITSSCSSLDTLRALFDKQSEQVVNEEDVGQEYSAITGPVVLTQFHITDLLVYSLTAGVVFSVLEVFLYLFLFYNSESKPMLLRATVFEVFNISVLVVSISLSASIMYYIINEPVRLDIESSGLLYDSSFSKGSSTAYNVFPANQKQTVTIPLKVNPDALRFEESTFRPVLDVPFDDISECFQDNSVLDTSGNDDRNEAMLEIRNMLRVDDFKENELCDFNNIQFSNSTNGYCYSLTCSNGVIPLATDKAVQDRIDFLYSNIVYNVLAIDISITFVDVLICILSVRKLRALFAGLNSDSSKSQEVSLKGTTL